MSLDFEEDASGTLFTWAVGTASAGNTTLSGVVSPATIGTQTHTATFSGLAANTRYLGRVEYGNGTGNTSWANRRRQHGHPEPYGVALDSRSWLVTARRRRQDGSPAVTVAPPAAS